MTCGDKKIIHDIIMTLNFYVLASLERSNTQYAEERNSIHTCYAHNI